MGLAQIQHVEGMQAARFDVLELVKDGPGLVFCLAVLTPLGTLNVLHRLEPVEVGRLAVDLLDWLEEVAGVEPTGTDGEPD